MKSVLNFLGVIILVFIILAISIAWSTWLIMLLLGVIHGSISDSVPPLGFWSTIPLGIIIGLLVGGSSTNVRD